MLSLDREYSYSELALVPAQKCIVQSRSECDTSVVFGGFKFKTPFIAANMPSVLNKHTCKFFAENNWFYIMHRFGVDQVEFIHFMRSFGHFTSISIGVNSDSYQQLHDIIAAKLQNDVDYITLDIAFCVSPKAERMIKYIKDNFPKAFLIVGNYNTPDHLHQIEEWGCDASKCGIAGGAACSSFNKTGFYRPMASCVEECVRFAKKPVIADGGVREHKDFAIALSLGATMVMAGSLFSCYDQSASQKIEIDGVKKCFYYGSASQFNKSYYSRIEGRKVLMDYKGDMKDLLREIEEDLQSSISYAGGKDISALKNCRKIRING